MGVPNNGFGSVHRAAVGAEPKRVLTEISLVDGFENHP